MSWKSGLGSRLPLAVVLIIAHHCLSTRIWWRWATIIGPRLSMIRDEKCKSLTVLPFWLNETNVSTRSCERSSSWFEVGFRITAKQYNWSEHIYSTTQTIRTLIAAPFASILIISIPIIIIIHFIMMVGFHRCGERPKILP